MATTIESYCIFGIVGKIPTYLMSRYVHGGGIILFIPMVHESWNIEQVCH
jgi:hypothetical protein